MYTVATVQTVGASESSRCISQALRLTATALSLYEYSITLEDEVRYIWQREHSAVTVAFVIMRYTNLLYCLLRIAQTRLSGHEDDNLSVLLCLTTRELITGAILQMPRPVYAYGRHADRDLRRGGL